MRLGRLKTTRSGAFTVYVNRRSGMAHRDRDCEALRDVPDGALRLQLVRDGQPRFRYCSRCTPLA